MIIEDARIPEDIPAIRALFRDYIDGLGLDLGFQDVERELATLPGKYASPRGAILMLRQGGQAMGIVAMRPLSTDEVEMKRLYLRDAAKGRGHGRALAVAVIGRAREAGYRLMRLDTQRDFVPARALYRSLGFVETPRYNDNPLPGAMFMALEL